MSCCEPARGWLHSVLAAATAGAARTPRPTGSRTSLAPIAEPATGSAPCTAQHGPFRTAPAVVCCGMHRQGGATPTGHDTNGTHQLQCRRASGYFFFESGVRAPGGPALPDTGGDAVRGRAAPPSLIAPTGQRRRWRSARDVGGCSGSAGGGEGPCGLPVALLKKVPIAVDSGIVVRHVTPQWVAILLTVNRPKHAHSIKVGTWEDGACRDPGQLGGGARQRGGGAAPRSRPSGGNLQQLAAR